MVGMPRPFLWPGRAPGIGQETPRDVMSGLTRAATGSASTTGPPEDPEHVANATNSVGGAADVRDQRAGSRRVTTAIIPPMSSRQPSAIEAERQLAAAAERHAEVVASVAVAGRSPSAQQSAARSLARGVQLVWFTLSRAAAAGVPLERLVELTGWDEALVREALSGRPEPTIVARLTPAGLDPDAVAQATASYEATARVDALLASIAADVGGSDWSPAGADLDDLCDRVGSAWRSWRHGLGRRND